VNAGDRSHWLDPSPPIDVDGEQPRAPRTRPRVLPPEEESPPVAADPAGDEQTQESETSRPA
jgi:hypothetical protein